MSEQALLWYDLSLSHFLSFTDVFFCNVDSKRAYEHPFIANVAGALIKSSSLLPHLSVMALTHLSVTTLDSLPHLVIRHMNCIVRRLFTLRHHSSQHSGRGRAPLPLHRLRQYRVQKRAHDAYRARELVEPELGERPVRPRRMHCAVTVGASWNAAANALAGSAACAGAADEPDGVCVCGYGRPSARLRTSRPKRNTDAVFNLHIV
ncbi:hypothetical protein GGX14DRAFT_563765 [Mycena pura]|uniref:Uncharacterized protein n=1 Tax=Mycena pura TaxID=153505 RepID=A0AAD6VHU6_9AGAR|nr:hypothetical protein GGX14DRAFT_563765 [Mycena pura]